VEAPTVGSVLLAGLILKIAGYAFLRFLLGFYHFIFLDLVFFIYTIGFFSFFYASMIALNQIDIKKIIAYSSVAHMNFALFGFFSYNLLSLNGAFFMLFGHALTSSALFLCVGVLYERYKTRILFYYEGLSTFMPLFSTIFFLFILSNFGFPGSANFVGEFLISIGVIYISPTFFFLLFLPMLLSLIFSLNLFVRISFGSYPFFLRFFSDLTRLEFYIFFIFFFISVLILGLFPDFFLRFFQISLLKLCI